MSKYYELPTAFLWHLLAGSITTSASTNSPARETACDVVLGHYSLLDGMTSDLACVSPVEHGVEVGVYHNQLPCGAHRCKWLA